MRHNLIYSLVEAPKRSVYSDKFTRLYNVFNTRGLVEQSKQSFKAAAQEAVNYDQLLNKKYVKAFPKDKTDGNVFVSKPSMRFK